MGFWKTFFASLLALTIFFFGAFFLFLAFVAALGAEEQVLVKDQSVLQINLDGQINEIQAENPFEGIPVIGNEIQTVGISELKKSLEKAKTDPKIKGVVLTVNYPLTGYASLAEIRQAIIDFKKSNKWVLAYSDYLSEAAYYVASSADKVYLNPIGDIEWNGLAVEVTFFKRMFDKLEIKPEIFRVGEFKSAVEPFMLDKMSEASKTQLQETVESLYDHVVNEVATSRNIDKAKLRTMADKMEVRNATQAVAAGLIDSLLYQDEFDAIVKSKLGLKEKTEINFIKLSKYQKTVNAISSSKNEIAVIVGEGEIVPGKGDENTIGGDSFANEVRKARLSSKVKAIVIRVNSPGGSFIASDKIWREVSLAAKEKPVIASMGDYAASGGYYMAMACDTIVAHPHTITGSIGIFSILFDASGLLSNKIGITSEEVKTGEFGELITVSRPLTTAEKAIWQKKTEEGYEVFTGKAAAGRNMPIEELKKVASGRVWTGSQALDRKLIDITGNVDDAIAIAAEKAGITADYKTKYVPRRKPFFEQLMSDLNENAKAKTVQQELGLYYPIYKQMQTLQKINGLQARIPYQLTIQ
ncbi:MAG: signal peptide peptidase SppA [Chryseotalea sp.]|jgi:protease-4